MNRDKHNHKLDNLYDVAGFSKQAHSQYMERRAKDEYKVQQVISSILEVRTLHSIMGLKKIYKLLSPDWIGRDSFIGIGVEYGLGIHRLRSYQRTTFSTKSNWFSNLTAGLEITDINQVWVGDTTYFRIADVFYYLTFIEDVYSRRILGYVAYPNLRAEANCIAMNMALKVRSGSDLRGLIHHSDRGSQYVSNIYLQILSKNKIAVSLCESVFENTHVERVNGIIKNEYLKTQSINTFEKLKSKLNESVKLYNEERPHWNLDCMTPCDFENDLSKIKIEDRKILKIFSITKKQYFQHQLF